MFYLLYYHDPERKTKIPWMNAVKSIVQGIWEKIFDLVKLNAVSWFVLFKEFCNYSSFYINSCWEVFFKNFVLDCVRPILVLVFLLNKKRYLSLDFL